MNQPRLLFVPVSGPRGMGEYARARAIATAVQRRWPDAGIHFALSREGPYSADTPFPKTLLPSSPTFHSREMVALIRDFQPTIAIFDNAGRTAQLRAAAVCGARVVFISSRRRQRRRAFRLRWMRILDEHWIAYPRFIAGELGPVEELKLRYIGHTSLRFIDSILPEPDSLLAESLLQRFGVHAGQYVLVVPGGGTAHRGAEDAPRTIAEAARRIAVRGYPTILVGVQSDTSAPPELRATPRLAINDVAELIRNASVVVSNGGDTLLQTLTCRRPCVATPIAGDQPHRIERCVRAGLAIGVERDAAALERSTVALLEDERRRSELTLTLRNAGFDNGLATALDALGRLAAGANGNGNGA